MRNFKWCRGNLGIQTAVGQVQEEIRIASFLPSFPRSPHFPQDRKCTYLLSASPRCSLRNTLPSSLPRVYLSIKADPTFERSEIFGMSTHNPSVLPSSWLSLSLSRVNSSTLKVLHSRILFGIIISFRAKFSENQ